MVSLRITRCTTEYADKPLGIDAPTPRFGWTLQSTRRDQSQSAYQIQVAASEMPWRDDGADVWNSGRVESAQCAHIPYAGPALKSGTRYLWRVRVWDGEGKPSDWSTPTWFETGLFAPEDWDGAQWIGAQTQNLVSTAPSPLLRRSFQVARVSSKARVYVSAAGYYELTINGKRVGDQVLDPAYSRFDRRIYYSVHDVTNLIRDGENVLGATLGRGWFGVTTPNVWRFHEAPWHGEPRFLLKFVAEDERGDKTVVVSDSTWTAHAGPTLADQIYVGDTFDARQAIAGWDRPGYDDATWDKVQTFRAPTDNIRATPLEPMRVTRTHKARLVAQPRPGIRVYDIGVNIAGWVRIKVQGPAGTPLVIRYAEKQDDKGLVHTDSDLVSAEIQVDRYTLNGKGTETWEPRFSYKGFRFVQVDSPADVPLSLSLEGREVHTDVRSTGTFACSDPMLNALHTMSRQSLLNNYHSIPTDTPVYEKNGWLGDAHLTAEAGLRNFDAARLYAKWLDDIADSQGQNGMVPVIAPDPGWGQMDAPEWGAAYILVADALYRHRGDTRVIKNHYQGMIRYMDYLEARAKDGISPSVLGDWLPPGYSGNPPEGPAVSAASYVFRCARVMTKFARYLGKEEDAARYERMAKNIADAVNTRFLNRDTATYQTDIECGYRQGSNILPLAFGMTPPDMEKRVLDRLIQDIRERGDHLNTGILGAAELLPLLTRHGHVDLALSVATQPTAPSWGYWVAQGSTTLWEAWGENARSRGHHMFGSIEDWFYQYLAGIHPVGEDRRILIRPYVPTRMYWARASVESSFGTVSSSWKKSDKEWALEVRVPVSCTARVEVPTDADSLVRAHSSGIQRLPDEPGRAVFLVGSGKTRFTVKPAEKQ